MRQPNNLYLRSQYNSLENLFRDTNTHAILPGSIFPIFGFALFTKPNHLLTFSQQAALPVSKKFSYPIRRTFLRRFQQSNIRKTKTSSFFTFFPSLNSSFGFSKRLIKSSKRSFLEPVYFGNSQKPDLSRFCTTWISGLGTSFEYARLKNRLSFLLGVPVGITILPALSFTRYVFDRESRGSTKLQTDSGAITSSRFIKNVENELSGRFQYVATNIPDLARLSFICIYFKKPFALSKIFALGLSTLPRNRKETQFLRFLIKLVKVFASQRSERLGVRIRFKGRVNRWRRTKYVSGDKGKLPLYTYSSRIEMGEAQAITRKGTLGIRIWIAYHPSFAYAFRRSITLFLYKTTN